MAQIAATEASSGLASAADAQASADAAQADADTAQADADAAQAAADAAQATADAAPGDTAAYSLLSASIADSDGNAITDPTTNEPVESIEPSGSTTSADETPPPTTQGATADTAQDAEQEDPDSGTSTTQSTPPAPTTTETPTASAPATSTTTTLLNAPESFQPDTKLDYSSAQPDA